VYKKARVLVVDDEPSVRVALERFLSNEGLQVKLAASGKEALEAIDQERPDVMVLDLNMPDMTGNDVCQYVRRDPGASAVGILILTGEKGVGLPAECINGGADDYLTKPVDMQELLARLRALLRRPRLYTTEDAVIEKGPVSLDAGKHRVSVKGKAVPGLTPKEFEMLRLLLLNAPRVIDNNTLALTVWGVPAQRLHRRSLNVHIQRIRKKLGTEAARYLKTVPNIGYQWLEAA